MTTTNILFFGSTSDSVIVLDKIFSSSTVNSQLFIAAIVTQPPKPVGREKIITPTPVELWGKAHHISVLSFESNADKPWLYKDEQRVIDTLESIQADVLISASYGLKIPWETISNAAHGGINVHPSILPRWRGADPVPWAILSNDHQIGVSIVTLSKTFDEGKILAQKKIPLLTTDTSDPLRTKLFEMGANLLLKVLDKPTHMRIHIKTNTTETSPYARKFTRDDGFESWETLTGAMTDGTDAERIERKFRALDPWPGVWTTIAMQVRPATLVNSKPENRRLKIVKLHVENGTLVLDQVQLEGKNPVSWEQFQQAYLHP